MIMLFVVVGIFVLIALLLTQPSIKGKSGELLVSFCLKNNLDPKTYRVINDVMIPDQNGGTTQIDHIVLSRFGIFVVETKTMQGWIFGNKESAQWTQQIYHSKHKFQNPFRQNYKHIACLSTITGVDQNAFTQVIFFVGDCKIKTKDTLPETLMVNGHELIQYIKSYKTERFSEDELVAIENAIVVNRKENSIQNKKEHIKYVQEIKIAKQEEKNENCPICGSPMILREVKKGLNAGQTFWGCSRYPQCRGYRNVHKE